MIVANTDDYKKTELFTYEGESYWPISPLRDGNCGLHAFTCGLIDSIITNKLSLETEKFNGLIRYIKQPSNTEIDISYSDNIELNIYISKFIDLISFPDLTFSKFKNFFIEHSLTRDRLAFINLIFSQALRTMGAEGYAKTLSITYLSEYDKGLLNNGTWVGEEVLCPLADYFGIHVLLIQDSSEKYCQVSPLPEGTIPTFALLLKNNHWHYLIPRKQTLGLAAVLPFVNTENKPKKTRRTSRDMLKSTNQLIKDIEKDVHDKQTDFTKATTLARFSEKFKAIFNFLKEIFSRESDQTNEFKQATKQAKMAAEESSHVINSCRETWDISHQQLDRHLNNLGFLEIEKALIIEPLIPEDSKNPAVIANAVMSTIVQNADIADFLSRNHTTFKKLNPSTPINNSSADMRDRNRFVTAHGLRNVAPCISV